MAKDKTKVLDELLRSHDPLSNISDPKKRARTEMEQDLDDLYKTDQADGQKYHFDKMKAQEEKDNLRRRDLFDLLARTSGPIEYKEVLIKYANYEIQNIGLPRGWNMRFFPTNQGEKVRIGKRTFEGKYGMVGVLISPQGTPFARAVTTLLAPAIDVAAVHTILTQAENVVDRYKGLLYESKAPKAQPPKLIY